MDEDFVTFEIAKKLEEKGFNWDRITIYNPRTKVRNNHLEPTISQVLKWLREEKKIHIMLDIWKVDINDIIYKWGYDIVDLTTTRVVGCDTQCANTYEQAAIAGIEYVLDNFI